jgi:hypothetical protein
MKLRIVVLALMVVTVGAVSIARADEASLQDREGDSQSLDYDIAEISHGHVRFTSQHPRMLTHTVSRHPGPSEDPVEIRFNFDTRGTNRAERSVIVSQDEDGSWNAELYSGGYPDDPRSSEVVWKAYARVDQLDERSFRIAFPRRLLGSVAKGGATAYRWFVEAYDPNTYMGFCEAVPMPGGGHGDAICYDRTSALRHAI